MWIFLEPYYGGSHRHLVDGLVGRLPFPVEAWTLPPRKWKWRMRGAALQLARRWHAEEGRLTGARGVLASSLLDAAALRGLLPPSARHLPLLLYCHENQLRYPVQVDDRRDYHYAWTNVQSILAADRVLWNSAYNRDSFLAELPGFLRRLPDERPAGLERLIEERSLVLPVPLDAVALAERSRAAPPRRGPCRILWNHRWEHDKDPEAFFDALTALHREGLEFEVAVLGQRFTRAPAVFARARAELAPRLASWGFVESRDRYVAELCRADVVVSTARHEFQGLAVLEAAACGCVPLVPDRLAYPEIWPAELRYRDEELVAELRRRIVEVEGWRRRDVREIALGFDWQRLLPRWIDLLAAAAP
ncbi:MAG TPA: DUF3524 domain-containing protein [Thermoanaerobaculia bacterium]|nr:DUF3524 domain-containing protein [Thermoanaerobaculia bacterium]